MIKEKGVIKQASIEDGEVVIKQILGEFSIVDEENRKVDDYVNVISVKFEKDSLLTGFEVKIPTVEKIDTQEDYIKLVSEEAKINAKHRCGMFNSDEEYNEVIAKIRNKYKDASHKITYKLKC